MRTDRSESVILWASYFDELAAVTFAHEFRHMGVETTLVAIHSQPDLRCGEINHPSRQSLEETIAMAAHIACLVIPSNAAALGQFEQQPALWALIGAVYDKGGRVVIGRSEGEVDPAIVRHLPPINRMIVYPRPDKLMLFARWLAHCLVRGEDLTSPRQAKNVPPLIRVASDSNPSSVAGAIAGILRDFGYAEVQSIGAAAGNQMLKAAAIAHSYLAVDNMNLFTVPEFATVYIGGQPRSAIRLFVSAWPTAMDKWVGWKQISSFRLSDEE